jgi:muconolactone delta-isomerase
MRYLVRTKSHFPAHYPAKTRSKLVEAEKQRARELHSAGALISTWRLPAMNETVTLWEAESIKQLHEWLMSLPAMAWASADVQPLIERNIMSGK